MKEKKMFFFYVGGLEQRVRRELKIDAGKCVNCGSRNDLVECEKALKFFIVPVLRWPEKEPLMRCSDCCLFFPIATRTKPLLDVLRCASCGGAESNFSFCPYCGSAL